MSVVIATGCPQSGWDKVLSAFESAGLEAGSCAFAKWHDEFFQAAGLTDPLLLRQPLLPEMGQGGNVLSGDNGAMALFADSRSLWLLDYWAESLPEARFLLFYTSAASAVAHALLQGLEPLAFLEGWKAANRQILAFQRRHRRRALLLDADAACRNPQAMVIACQRLDIRLEFPPNPPPPQPDAPALERLIADLLLKSEESVASLQVELEVSAQPLGDAMPPAPALPLEVLESYLQRQVCERKLKQDLGEAEEKLQTAVLEKQEQGRVLQQAQSQIEELIRSRDESARMAAERQVHLEKAQKDATQENELLLLQLHQVQEELEAVFLEKQRLEQGKVEQEKQLQDLTKSQEQLTEEAAARRKELEALASKQKELSGQVAQLQTQLKQLTKERDDLNKLSSERQAQLDRSNQAKAEAEARETELQQAYQDLKNTHADAIQENELLLLQLHQVQEELETIFQQKQQLEQAHRVLEIGMKSAPSELRQVLSVEDKGIADQKSQAKEWQADSWKISAQVRGILKPFKGAKDEKDRIRKQMQLLKSSGLFDEEWYLAEYPDVAADGADPVEHYIRFGAAEGRDPSPAFVTNFYLQSNPDVAEDGINPLVHYVKFGKAENRPSSNRGSAA